VSGWLFKKKYISGLTGKYIYKDIYKNVIFVLTASNHILSSWTENLRVD